VRDLVRARPVLLGPLPDGLEPRARWSGRRSGRRDRLVYHCCDRGGWAARGRSWDLPRLAAAVERPPGVTLVGATLVQYHLRDYEAALAGSDVLRRETEQALEGLRYVRNQLGQSADPAGFIHPPGGDGAWTLRPLPEPALAALAPRARQWEVSRGHAHQARLAGRDIARTIARCTEFLTRAATLASASSTAPPGP
jgi:hypothetical protein